MTLTVSAALKMLTRTRFRPFDKNDWAAYAGCESANPLIGCYGQDWQIVAADDYYEFYYFTEEMVQANCWSLAIAENGTAYIEQLC
jgi:hypothetical protein